MLVDQIHSGMLMATINSLSIDLSYMEELMGTLELYYTFVVAQTTGHQLS